MNRRTFTGILRGSIDRLARGADLHCPRFRRDFYGVRLKIDASPASAVMCSEKPVGEPSNRPYFANEFCLRT